MQFCNHEYQYPFSSARTEAQTQKAPYEENCDLPMRRRPKSASTVGENTQLKTVAKVCHGLAVLSSASRRRRAVTNPVTNARFENGCIKASRITKAASLDAAFTETCDAWRYQYCAQRSIAVMIFSTVGM